MWILPSIAAGLRESGSFGVVDVTIGALTGTGGLVGANGGVGGAKGLIRSPTESVPWALRTDQVFRGATSPKFGPPTLKPLRVPPHADIQFEAARLGVRGQRVQATRATV